jgi:hypothetical protein
MRLLASNRIVMEAACRASITIPRTQERRHKLLLKLVIIKQSHQTQRNGTIFPCLMLMMLIPHKLLGTKIISNHDRSGAGLADSIGWLQEV